MNPDESTPVDDERFAVLLEAYDNALKGGQAATVSEMNGGAAQPRLDADLPCLRLLNQVRPRHRSTLSPETSALLFTSTGLALPDPRVGTRLGKYLLQRRLGQGGMGVVYEAEDMLVRRRVAVKLLTGALTAEPAARERLLREARAAGRLNHPNVVAIHEVGEQESDCYLVMELVPGGSAQDILESAGALPWPEATRLAAGVCRALAAAHAAGLLHRDIKPANILRGPDGEAKLADFGLAKIIQPGATILTAAGAVLGTPAYMSPEQCRSGPIDERSDLYSLGATYFALLTGHGPYPAGDPMAAMFAHCHNPVPDPRAADTAIPADCAAIVQQAMAKDPTIRFPSAAAMLNALEAVLSGTMVPLLPPPARPTPKPVPPLVPKKGLLRRLCWNAALIAVVLMGQQLYWFGHGNMLQSAKAIFEHYLPAGTASGETPEWESLLDGPVRAVAFSPDGKWLAAANGNNGAKVWEMDGPSPQLRAHWWTGQEISALAFSGDNTILAAAGEASAGSSNPIILRHLRDGTVPDLGNTLSGEGRALAFSPDGRSLAAASQDGNKALLAIWRWAATGKLKQRTITVESKPISALAFSPDSQCLALGNQNGAVKLWDPADGRLLEKLKIAEDIQTDLGGVQSLAFFRDAGELFLNVDLTKGTVLYWTDGRRGAVVKHFTAGPPDPNWYPPSNCVAITGSVIAHGGNYQISIRDGATGEQVYFVGHAGATRSIALAPGGRYLATGGADRFVKLWDSSRFREK